MSGNGAGVSASDRIRDLEEARAKRREATAAARDEQRAIDMEALMRLEEEHGEDSVAVLAVNGFRPGLPTFVVVKSPGGSSYYKRYVDQVRKAGKNGQLIGAAQDMLGASSIIYPSDEAMRTKMFDAFPGACISAAVRALKFVELEEEEEKKG